MDDQEKELRNAEDIEESIDAAEPTESAEDRAEKHAKAQSNLNDLLRVLDQAEGKQTSKISKVEVTHKRPRTVRSAPAHEEQASAPQTPEPEQPKQSEQPEQPTEKPAEPKKRPAHRRAKETSRKEPKPVSGAAVRKREREARRRRRRTARVALVIAVVLLALIAVVAAVRGITGRSTQSTDSANGSGSGSGVTTAAETEKSASQQETAQYLAIKDDDDLPDYAKEYPGLYADAVSEENTESAEKVCYLTFDDGPSSTVTPKILDTLKEAGVKATFFLVGSEIDGNEDLIQRMVDEGHTICIHANAHDYGTIYPSVEDYLADFAEVYDKIYELTGYRVQGLRFPGGSNNVVMARHDTYDAIVTEMTRRGFEYYDWNAYDHDAEGGDYTPQQMEDYAVGEVTASSRTDVILLMHDTYGKEGTAEALPGIISRLQEAGIELKPITNTTRPVHFEVDDSTPSEFPTAAESADDSDAAEESETDAAGADSEEA